MLKNIHVTHHLERHEISRLKALAVKMTESVKPKRPYDVRILLKIYGWSGCADLFGEYCKDYGVSSYYSPATPEGK